MDVCLASHRAILKALQAFEDGELALILPGALTLHTPRGDVRFFDGTCLSAPDPAWVGAELVGWLEELDGLSGVGAWWRPGLRAVLRTLHGRPLVTACSQDLSIGGLPAASGFATHTARFLVAHGDTAPALRAEPSPAAALQSGVRPVVPRPPGPEIAASRAIPRPSAARATAPTVPHAPDTDTALRARGEWRSTSVVPWTLGEGRASPRLTEPSFNRLARLAR